MEAIRDAKVEAAGEFFFASNPKYGAVSALSARELVAFHLFRERPHDAEPLQRFFQSIGYGKENSADETRRFRERMIAEGWLRTALPDVEPDALSAVYFTVTRDCDLACPYCYQGLENRKNTEMPVEQARLVLDKIKAMNPDCHVIVTGGEPFLHSRILEILDLVGERGFLFTILTNGTRVTAEIAERLKRYPRFRAIQISLDGMTEETFSLTRGRSAFLKVMAAIQSVIDAGLPFLLAPTLHEGNLHELADIAEFAIANGGYISPNNLRHFPHDYNKRAYDPDGKIIPIRQLTKSKSDSHAEITHKLVLGNDALMLALKNMRQRLSERFSDAMLDERGARYEAKKVCSLDTPNSTFTCGMGHSLLDIDWNGEVYPCHLSKAPELVIGNIFREEFADIFATVERRKIRVKSYEIPKCSGCKFNSTCGSGCRAGAYFAYGTFMREDDLCDLNYRSASRQLIAGARARNAASSDDDSQPAAIAAAS